MYSVSYVKYVFDTLICCHKTLSQMAVNIEMGKFYVIGNNMVFR